MTPRYCFNRRVFQQGFSLIELLVSVALFTVVMTVSVGTLLALVNANQKAQSMKSVVNNLNFALDSMSRTIRTGRTYHCTDTISGTLPMTTADCAGGAKGLVLTDDHGNRLAYRYINAGIERNNGTGGWVELTAPEVVIDDMRFYVTGSTAGDGMQPMVTLSIRGHAGTKDATQSAFNVETTVTQRVLDQ